MNFLDFDLNPAILEAVDALGFKSPSDIQQKAIPILKDYHGDFVGQAQTGTGKTAAFIIPLLEKLNPQSKKVQALILTPTRELANQVYEEVEKLSKFMAIKSTTVYGGTSYSKQLNALKKDFPQIVVGTPGRVQDLIDRGALKLGDCGYLVIDEADEMLNMGFIDDVKAIMEALDSEKKMWMFSATIPQQISQLIKSQFNEPKMVKVEKKTLSNEDIQQFFCLVKKRRYFEEVLHRFIENEEDLLGVVFCETRRETKELADFLATKGISVVSLHGDLGQDERDMALRKFKEKRTEILVCTDVAARGIDVSNVTHVFNMGLPRHNESYVHRIGRTGRAGLKGKAISFITPEGFSKLRRVERLTGQRISPLKLPKTEDLKKRKVQRDLAKMEGLKLAITEKKNEFKVDPIFEEYKAYFDGLNREEALQLIFSFQFNKEFRQLEEYKRFEAHDTGRKEGKGKPSRSGSRNRKRKSNDSSGHSFGSRRSGKERVQKSKGKFSFRSSKRKLSKSNK